MAYHECTYRVPYADTDQMGVVYYGNYLEYFERSRTEMLRAVGLPYSELEQRDIILPVREAHCVYEASAHYDELITLRSWVEEARGARLVVATEVWHGETRLVHGTVTLACINREHKITRLAPELLAACRRLTRE